MEYSRRSILGTSAAGLAGIAGCLSEDDMSNQTDGSGTTNGNTESNSDTDNDGVPNENDAYPNDEDLSQKNTKSDTRKIEEDEWRYHEFEFESTGFLEYEFIVREGPEIDVIFLEESEYTHFEEGDRYAYKSEMSAHDSSGATISGKVSSGSYRLLLDNSNKGEATPPTNFSNDVVTVEYDMELGK